MYVSVFNWFNLVVCLADARLKIKNHMKVSLDVSVKHLEKNCIEMNFSFHLQKKLILSQIAAKSQLGKYYFFFSFSTQLINYVQDIRFSRPENYIMFLGCHTKRNVLMSSKNNIVQLTSCYFSLCFECQNGLWDFKKGYSIGYKKWAKYKW